MTKKILLVMWAVLALAVLSGCSTMKRVDNIVEGSEFIPCSDPNCGICQGTGLYDCPECGGTAIVTCAACEGTKVRVHAEWLNDPNGKLGGRLLAAALTFGTTCDHSLKKVEDLAADHSTLIDAGYQIDSEGYVLAAASEREQQADGTYKTVWNRMSCGDDECVDGIIPCPDCDGTGEVTCAACDGEGKLPCGETVYFATCTSCGERLTTGATQCTACGLNAKVFTCRDCGAKFNEESDVCPECGAGA